MIMAAQIFPRCAQGHVPQYPVQFIAHEQDCHVEPRRGAGRPRKYPDGYKQRYQYKRGGARRGAKWDVELIREELGKYGPFEYRGEKLYPLAWIAATLRKHRKTILIQVKREGLPYVLTGRGRYGLACVREAEARHLLDVVNFRVRNVSKGHESRQVSESKGNGWFT